MISFFFEFQIKQNNKKNEVLIYLCELIKENPDIMPGFRVNKNR